MESRLGGHLRRRWGCFRTLSWVTSVLLTATLTATAKEVEQPKAQDVSGGRMLHVVVRDVDIKYNDGSFLPSTRHTWLCMGQGLRIEVPENVQKGLCDLFIRTKANTWAVYRSKNIGQHTSDTVESDITRLRLFGPPEPPEINRLSLGYELEFFQDMGAERLPPQKIDSAFCDVYQIKVDSTQLTLYARQSTGFPYLLSIRSPYKQFSMRYEVYERWLPCDTSLFVPPSGVVWEEVKQP